MNKISFEQGIGIIYKLSRRTLRQIEDQQSVTDRPTTLGYVGIMQYRSLDDTAFVEQNVEQRPTDIPGIVSISQGLENQDRGSKRNTEQVDAVVLE